jgi:hypothetical protein
MSYVTFHILIESQDLIIITFMPVARFSLKWVRASATTSSVRWHHEDDKNQVRTRTRSSRRNNQAGHLVPDAASVNDMSLGKPRLRAWCAAGR